MATDSIHHQIVCAIMPESLYPTKWSVLHRISGGLWTAPDKKAHFQRLLCSSRVAGASHTTSTPGECGVRGRVRCVWERSVWEGRGVSGEECVGG